MDLLRVVVALVDVRQQRVGAHPLDGPALLVAGLLADGEVDDAEHGEVGDRVVHGLAQHHVAGDPLQPADLLMAGAVDQHGAGVEALAVHRGQELEVEVELGGRCGQRERFADRAADLDEGDAVAGERGVHDESVTLHAHLAELLRLAEHLTAAGQGPLVGHRHDQRVPALVPVVDGGDGDGARAERIAGQIDLADVRPDERSSGGFQGRWEDGRHRVGVALPDGAHAGGPDVGEPGAGLAGRRDLGLGARAVPYTCHAVPPFSVVRAGFCNTVTPALVKGK